MPEFDLTTRIGRVQAAWWLRDRGAPEDILPGMERIAYETALLGDDTCDVGALRTLIELYQEDK